MPKSDARVVAELLDGDRGTPPTPLWCLLRLHRWERWSEVQERAMRMTHAITDYPLMSQDYNFVQTFQYRNCAKCGLHEERVIK